MRSLLLSIFALFTTLLVSAQGFQLGLDGGIVYNTKPASTGDNYDNNQHRFAASALKAIYNHHHWQYGLNIGYRENSFSGSYFHLVFYNSILPVIPPDLVPYTVSQKEFPFKLFINRKITFKHLETYIGPFIGYTFATSKEVVSVPNEPHPTQYSGWLIGGIQVGTTYFITKRFGINIELSTEYNIHLGSDKDQYTEYSFPATLGLRYKI